MKIEIRFDGIWTARCAKADALDLLQSKEMRHPISNDGGIDESRDVWGASEVLEAYAGSPEKALHELMSLIGRVTISTLPGLEDRAHVGSRGRK